ncbi:MAG TPA: glycosyltransferase family 2 protein [Chitinophagaceae bacterium]|nr:glycosyltransferase family 2 protein [Chitinophagaceae bacterium]
MCKIAVLITSYNRREKTLTCLKNIMEQEPVPGLKLEIYLVDDNSSDGTTEAVRSHYPSVNVIKGSGQLFWAGGMRTAWREALKEKEKFEYYLLVNDDTFLYKDAFKKLFADKQRVGDNAILIGSIRDPVTGDFSYGGRLLKNKYNISSTVILPNNSSPQLCDLGNGNVMMIPAVVVDKIGILSDRYTHGLADIEYTTKAKKAHIPSYVSSFYLGECKNDYDPTIKNRLSLKQRIEYLYSVKGLSYKEYLYFIRNYFPLYLPQAWLSLWIKTIVPSYKTY